jgi:PAS domain S-box-containing protein
VSQVDRGAPRAGGGGIEGLARDRATQHYAAIVESSDDAILSKDLDGVITSWNQGAQRLFGYTAEEAVGRSVTILIPADRHNEEPMILERIGRCERIDHYETIRQRKDGNLLDISLTVSPIKKEKGEVVGASKIARDITAHALTLSHGPRDMAGRIQIHDADHGETLVVIRTERGGPETVQPTSNNGFGELLIRSTIACLGGEIFRDWQPEGLVIRLSIPRARETAAESPRRPVCGLAMRKPASQSVACRLVRHEYPSVAAAT